MPTWNEIKENVERNGNLLTVTMEMLREAHGAGRLGVNVRAEISSTLAGMGLGHVPQDLPAYQHELVRLFKYGTSVGELITTVLTPGEQNDSQLREQHSGEGPDYASIVRQIRELVAE